MTESQPTEARQAWGPFVEVLKVATEHDLARIIEFTSPKAPAGADSAKDDHQRPDGTQTKTQRRAPPKDRDLRLIWDLTQMTSKEPNLIASEGKYEPGHSFFQRHVSRKSFTATTPRSVMEATVEKQKQWMGRLRRVKDRMPGFLLRQKSVKEQTWKLGVSQVLQVFFPHDIDTLNADLIKHKQNYTKEFPTADHGCADRKARWTTNLEWMIEHNFQGFTQAGLESLKESLRLGYDDVVLSWMRRLISHIRQRTWALGAGRDEGEEPILMDMIAGFTSYEIILAMAQLIEIMLEVAEHDLRGLELMVASNSWVVEREKLFKLRWEDCFDLMRPAQPPYYGYTSHRGYVPSGGHESHDECASYGNYARYASYTSPYYLSGLYNIYGPSPSRYGFYGGYGSYGGYASYGSPDYELLQRNGYH